MAWNLIGSLLTRRPRHSGRHACRPSLEFLEDRLAPAGRFLDGDLLLGPADRLDVSVNFRDTNPHHRVSVQGSVEIDGAALNIVSLGEHTKPGDRFTLIENDGADPVEGAFAGLPEGSVITLPTGARLQISYQGGKGNNDVVLTRLNAAPQFQNRTVTALLDEGGTATLTGSIVDPDPLDTFFLDVDWGDGFVETFKFAPGTPRDVSVTHTYADDAEQYTIQLTWRDQTDFGNSAELFTQVENVRPTVEAGSDAKAALGTTFQRVASFSDPGQDRWTAQVDYGDGAVETIRLDAEGKFKLSHQYRVTGTYEVTVTVIDDDGGMGEATFLVFVG